MEWPDNSQNRNPIEELRSYMNLKHQERDTLLISCLVEALQDFWVHEIDQDYCRKLYVCVDIFKVFCRQPIWFFFLHFSHTFFGGTVMCNQLLPATARYQTNTTLPMAASTGVLKRRLFPTVLFNYDIKREYQSFDIVCLNSTTLQIAATAGVLNRNFSLLCFIMIAKEEIKQSVLYAF